MKVTDKPRKCIHIKLNWDTHIALRTELFKKDMSIQEFFEELASKFSDGHPGLHKLADKYVKRRTQKKIEKIAGLIEEQKNNDENTIEAIYSMIEKINPLGTKKEENDETVQDVLWESDRDD